MEYWESKTEDVLILIFDRAQPYKIRSYSTKPKIPTFQYSMAIDYGRSVGAIDPRRSTGF